MSQALRKLTATIGKSRTILIFINQIRMKIGVMFGNPETTTGGNALKFYASVRLEVRKMETIEKGEADAVGNKVRVKVVKNKVAPPFRKAELDIMFGKGVSAVSSILDAAVKYEIIDKKGAWYAYGEEKIGQGRDNARDFLENNPALTAEIEKKLRAIMFPGMREPEIISQPAATSGPSTQMPEGLAQGTKAAGIAAKQQNPQAAAAASSPAGTSTAGSRPGTVSAAGPRPATASAAVPKPATTKSAEDDELF